MSFAFGGDGLFGGKTVLSAYNKLFGGLVEGWWIVDGFVLCSLVFS